MKRIILRVISFAMIIVGLISLLGELVNIGLLCTIICKIGSFVLLYLGYKLFIYSLDNDEYKEIMNERP